MKLPEVLNTIQLHKILTVDKFVQPLFRGVYARDELPRSGLYPSCLVVNTHSSSEPGEHWLAIYYDMNGICEFFDSFGLPPAAYRLGSYLKRTSTRVKWNHKCYQPLDSNACGYYCFLYLMFRCRDMDFKAVKKNMLIRMFKGLFK